MNNFTLIYVGLICSACGSSAEETSQPSAATPTAAAAPNVAAGAVSLTPGFMPDPMVLNARAGGAVDASTLNAECHGFVAAEPNHTLVTTANFASLRIVVNAGETDTTLVVRKPNGSYWCNDDGPEGLHPLLEGAAPAGTYAIFVGTFTPEAAGANYRIGFSEMTSTTASSLAAGN